MPLHQGGGAGGGSGGGLAGATATCVRCYSLWSCSYSRRTLQLPTQLADVLLVGQVWL